MQKSASATPAAVRSSSPRDARSQHARLLDLRAGALGAFEQHAVQVEARINQQRLVQLQLDFARVGRGKRRPLTNLLGVSLSIRNGYC